MAQRVTVRERIDPAITASLFANYRSSVDAVMELVDNAIDSRLKGSLLEVLLQIHSSHFVIETRGGEGMGPGELERNYRRWGGSPKRGRAENLAEPALEVERCRLVQCLRIGPDWSIERSKFWPSSSVRTPARRRGGAVMRHGKLFLVAVAGLMAAASSLPATAAPPPAFTNVQVNQVLAGPFPKNKQNEPSIAQNPTNSLNLIASSNDEIALPACTNVTPSSCPFTPGVSISGFYASFDGGGTWPCQGLIDLSAFGETAFGDPAQAFDSRGNAYYGTLAFPFPPTTPELATGVQADFFVAKSTDGGCHYSSAARVSGASPAIFDDKDAITADSNRLSPFRDNVYAVWTKFTGQNSHGFGSDQIEFARSTDGGLSWSDPLPLSPSHNNNATGGRQGAAVKVGADGTVFVVWLDTVDKVAVERMSISRDGGNTFPGPNITVATVTDDFVSPLPGSSFRQDSRTFPSLSIAPKGALYVAWSNHTGGHAVVLVAHSTNGGLTWSAPAIAGDVSGRSAFFATVAADPGNNVNVGFLAMDDKPVGTAPGAGVLHYDAYFTRSTDGGASFSSPLKISKATSDPDGSSTNSLRAQFLGDYITGVADSGHFYAVWTDSRNATPCAAVDAFRAGTAGKPNVITKCPNTFGNTDIFLGTVSI